MVYKKIERETTISSVLLTGRTNSIQEDREGDYNFKEDRKEDYNFISFTHKYDKSYTGRTCYEPCV